VCGRAPGAWPVLGHAVALRRRPLELLASLPAHGDLVELRLGPRRAFVLCHPELARPVLTDFRTFDRTGFVYERVRLVMGNGLATAGQQDHRRQRPIMQPAFRHEHLRGYVAVMQQEVTAAMNRWRPGTQLDLVDEMFTLTTAVALRTLFGSRLGPAEAEGLRTAFDRFLRGIYTRTLFPAAGRLPIPANRRYAEAAAYWRRQVSVLIERAAEGGSEGGDLLARLLAARDDEGRGLSAEELSDQVAVLLIAGGETTSAAVVWATHLLGRHPEVLAALQAEARAVLGRAAAGWDHLPRLELTARVVRETLRLYPPAWVLPRVTTRPVTLAGRELRAGSVVIFSPYVLHHRAELFAEPERFDPDRWLEPDRDTAAVQRSAFLPFGAGATKCIGADFGQAEATVILASIAARWDLQRPPAAPVKPAARAVLVPKSFPVRLAAR
jgi:cytochrome P450